MNFQNLARVAVLVVSLPSLVLTASSARADDTSALPPVRTVDSVNLQRYAGTWYEIARIPNRFQDDCVGDVTASYELREDGKITVINRCREEGDDFKESKGVAKIADASSGSKLKVSFFSVLGWRPAWGDYWVLALGDEYEYAVVGTPDRKYGWILARSATPSPLTLEAAWSALESNGYSRTAFTLTSHQR